MGIIKQHLIEEHESNLLHRHTEDKYVCSHHIDDYAIKDFILKYSDIGRCSYCKNKRKVALVKDVVNFINNGLGVFYEDPANSMGYDSSEGGYLGTVFEIEELIDEVGLDINNYQLQEDITNSFDNTPWCEIDPYGDRESEYLKYNWDYFKDIVKHKARYLFSQTDEFKKDYLRGNPFEILHDVGRRVDRLNLFTWVNKGSLLYRCRQHKTDNEIKGAKDMGSPPLKFATLANRMSPAGISMFYCAFDKNIASVETLEKTDKSKPFYTLGTFKTKEKLFLLDLSIPLKVPSMFDEKNKANYFSIIFLKNFINDLTKEIKRDGYEHIDYIPTQVVTEYFRYTFCNLTNSKIDGIIYPSSKDKSKASCVLFLDNEESLKNLDFIRLKTYPV
ncbi:MAG: HEPN-associated N-terminal domain-containing protein [Sediminibacterium sp.]|nr:HEPN-associated N-terminal domain-containing protein [Sediminibacterium sp.]